MSKRSLHHARPDLDAIRDALDASEGLDAGRVEVTGEDGQVVLTGSVRTQKEALVAVLLTEGVVEDSVPVIDAIEIDEMMPGDDGAPDRERSSRVIRLDRPR